MKKAKIISQFKNWALVKCPCGATTDIKHPLPDSYACVWCGDVVKINLKSILTQNNKEM